MKNNWKVFISLMTILLCGITITGCDGDDDVIIEENPPTYFYYGGHSYRIVKEKEAWSRAAFEADSLGGYLAEIGSKAEQEAIWQGILDSKISPTYLTIPDGGYVGYMWIGAIDMAKEGSWFWNGANKGGYFQTFWEGNNTGTAINGAYVNWGGTSKGTLNEPDNYTHASLSPKGQNAAAIALADWPVGDSNPLGIAGEWNDINDQNFIYFIVEFDEVKK